MKKLTHFQCRLSYIKNLSICQFEHSDLLLSKFLLKCAPLNLSSLNIEFESSIFKFCADIYCSGLATSVSGVTDEVFLNNLAMNSTTFETVVKAASKAERLVFLQCKLDSLPQLDFQGPEDYR